MIRLFLIGLFCILLTASVFSQGIEDVMIEEFYPGKYSDSTFKGSYKTYRIYFDLAPGYSLQAVFGDAYHELLIEAETAFYNDVVLGGEVANHINRNLLIYETVLFDSWLTIGAATRTDFAVLRDLDPDGSILKQKGFEDTDGLYAYDSIPTVIKYGLDLEKFESKGGRIFSNNGAWAHMGKLPDFDPENRILIAQLTSNSDITCKLNVQVSSPHCGVEKYVYENPQKDEKLFEKLSFTIKYEP